MNVILTLVLGIIVLSLFLAVFLWSARQRRENERSKVNSTDFNLETAQEFSVPIPDYPYDYKPATGQELELPRSYGLDRLVLMVRDPHWLFAYWEISATKQDEFEMTFGRGAWSSSRPVLRIYEVAGESFTGDNLINFTDIGIQEEADNWYINVGKANSTFCVDLGRVLPDGRFVTILRSNMVTTPRVSVSECLDEEWMWIEEIYNALSMLPYGMSSPLLAIRMGGARGIQPLGISSPGVSSPGFSPSRWQQSV